MRRRGEGNQTNFRDTHRIIFHIAAEAVALAAISRQSNGQLREEEEGEEEEEERRKKKKERAL